MLSSSLMRSVEECVDGSGSDFVAGLLSGGDSRLRVDSGTGLNLYGCSPVPRAAEISLSSTTASTISTWGFQAARQAYRHLGSGQPRSHERHAEAIDSLRTSLTRIFAWDDAEVIFSPSGTDSEILLQHLARLVLGEPLTSVIVAADETGSGVPLAAAGRHFGDVTCGGRAVVKGEPVAGLAHPVVAIRIRDIQGAFRPLAEIDRDVELAVDGAVKSGHRVVLHVMEHSKTGAGAPSAACVANIEANHRSKVQVVVDACQFRASASHLAGELRRGRILLLTGSKFFAGPPLSGAIVLPASLAARLKASPAVPIGLGDYSASTDWPLGWDLRKLLPERANVGQLLRWTSAIAEMERYKAVPLVFRAEAMTMFETAMEQAFDESRDCSLLSAAADVAIDRGDEFANRTVFAFTVQNEDGPLDPVAARLMYRALNVDMSGLIAHRAAARLCHIGQPVTLGTGDEAVGALRMSVDARFIAECWDGGCEGAVERVQCRCTEIGEVLDKISVLLPHMADIEPFLRQLSVA